MADPTSGCAATVAASSRWVINDFGEALLVSGSGQQATWDQRPVVDDFGIAVTNNPLWRLMRADGSATSDTHNDGQWEETR